MSSNKTFNVDCELILHYGLEIKAKDEDEAREKAESRLNLIAENVAFQKQLAHHDTDFGDIELAD